MLSRLDQRVAEKFGLKEFSSIQTDSNKILYFNNLGQPIVEYTMEARISKDGQIESVVLEFVFANKLTKGVL